MSRWSSRSALRSISGSRMRIHLHYPPTRPEGTLPGALALPALSDVAFVIAAVPLQAG